MAGRVAAKKPRRASPGTATKKPAQTREEMLQDEIIKWARNFGWLVFHPYDSRRSTPGFPDLVLIHEDPAGGEPAVLFWELKSESGRVGPEQVRWLAALTKAKRVEVALVRPENLRWCIRRLRERG